MNNSFAAVDPVNGRNEVCSKPAIPDRLNCALDHLQEAADVIVKIAKSIGIGEAVPLEAAVDINDISGISDALLTMATRINAGCRNLAKKIG